MERDDVKSLVYNNDLQQKKRKSELIDSIWSSCGTGSVLCLVPGCFPLDDKELKQRRFWAMRVNWEWTFWILEQLLRLSFQGNRHYKGKDTKQCT